MPSTSPTPAPAAFRCSECDFTAPTIEAVLIHKAEHHDPADEEPLPCPFCGSRPEIEHVPEGEFLPEIPESYWSCGCVGNRDCPASPITFGDTRGEAIAIWNTRHQPTQPK